MCLNSSLHPVALSTFLSFLVGILVSDTCWPVCTPKVYCQCLPVNMSLCCEVLDFTLERVGDWKDNLIGHLEKDHWPFLWAAVPSAKSSFLPAPYAHCCWLWREACLLHISTQHRSTLPVFLSSLKDKFPALFPLRLVGVLNSSLPIPAAVILVEPLLTLHVSSWGEIPWLQYAMAKPWSWRRTRHPQKPSHISRISLTLIKLWPVGEQKNEILKVILCSALHVVYLLGHFKHKSDTRWSYKITFFINLPYHRAWIFLSNNARSKRKL